ncbi:hypothetical protein BEN49_04765 [Hymenobacter coccineus]|uniref:Uncharacterized protein n=1 Tax=Hymenobacter coccineus TaxID=1908235 RepID=A0A1G1TKU2_9BACT|nr:hypothetical protein BEN49_04765 [Hymenobacter coccineus]
MVYYQFLARYGTLVSTIAATTAGMQTHIFSSFDFLWWKSKNVPKFVSHYIGRAKSAVNNRIIAQVYVCIGMQTNVFFFRLITIDD